MSNGIVWDAPTSGIVWDDEKKPTAQDKYTATAQEDSNSDNFIASIGGAMYAPYLGAKQLLGKSTPEEVQQWKDSMAGLWSTPMGKFGAVVGGAAAAAPAAVVAGPSAVGAGVVGAGLGALQPTSEGESRLANTAIGGGGGVAGKYAADLVGKGASALFAKKTADLSTRQAGNAVRDATISEVQGAGYVIPPNQINPSAPGLVNRLTEGFAGKIQTGQLAGIKNQKVTDALAKRELGLPPDVPLTSNTLQQVRSTAGQFYDQLKKFGPVQTDAEFGNAMNGVVGEYAQLARNMPSQRVTAIDALIEDLNKPQFNSSDAVELVKRLRHDGFKNVRSPDPASAQLGRVQIGAQNAIEDLMDRNLAASGNADFLPAFRNARTMIAKSYTIENALEDSTGKVVASKIGREYSKGRPLTGGLATIGKMAEAFPKAVQNVNSSMPGISPLDYGAGILGSAASGNVLPMAAVAARPIVRAGILSGPGQRLLAQPPSYQMGLLGRQLPKLDSNTLKLMERLGLTSGLLSVPGGNP